MPNWNFVKRQLKFDKPRSYSQKHTNRKRKHNYFTTKTMHYIHVHTCIYLIKNKHHHNMKQFFFISYEINTFSII